MIKVGLTGNRFSGKDRVTKLFGQISIPVFHADIILKFIIQYNLEFGRRIKSKMDPSIYDAKGQLDPSKIDSDKFNQIINIVQPELFRVYQKFQLNQKNKSIYTIFHSSILFERDWYKDMDFNISVFSPRQDRIKRAKDNTDLPTEIIYDLVSKEMDELDKNKLSTYIIHNYDDAIDITKQVDNIDQQIIDRYLRSEHTKKTDSVSSAVNKKIQTKIYPL